MEQEAIFSTGASDSVKAILRQCSPGPGDLLPVLHLIQDTVGFIPPESVADIAALFNLSRAEVHGVVTFYHYFRTTPPATYTVQVCRAEACQSMGADQLLMHAEKMLGCALHQKSTDGRFSLEPVYCLGQCATAPAIMINQDLHARVTPSRFDKLISQVQAKEKP